jgi:uncharacterized membrane protein required for colicin V production
MGPIEFAFLALWAMFGIIGWIRGFAKELGITLIMVAAVLAAYYADTQLAARPFFGGKPWLMVAITSGIIIFGALIAYEGQTITFPIKDPKGFWGNFFAIFVGLLNGYLIVGSIWYYMNKYGYPGGIVMPPLTALATSILAWLPLNLIPPDYVRNVLIGSLLFLLLLRVIR